MISSSDKMMLGELISEITGLMALTDADGANIAVTAGTYDMILDTVNGTYTLTVN